MIDIGVGQENCGKRGIASRFRVWKKVTIGGELNREIGGSIKQNATPKVVDDQNRRLCRGRNFARPGGLAIGAGTVPLGEASAGGDT